MSPELVLLAALIGYLAGSISAARAVVKTFAPGHVMDGIRAEVPEGEAVFESNVISATTVRLHLGSRYGCLTSILDMLKAGLPALAFRLWQPDQPYYLIAAAAATIGHIWPLYHHFRGGRGMSPILGGMLVLAPLGVVITQMIGGLTGLLIKNTLIMIGTGTVLMIPWVWFLHGSLPELLYVTAMNILFWTAMLPEVREYRRLKREGSLEQFAESSQIRIVGRRGNEIAQTGGMTRIRNRLKELFSRTNKTT